MLITSGLELRIWKGKAIYKKGTLDLKGHFDQAKGHFVQAKGHQGHPRNFRKGTKAKKKNEKNIFAIIMNRAVRAVHASIVITYRSRTLHKRAYRTDRRIGRTRV